MTRYNYYYRQLHNPALATTLTEQEIHGRASTAADEDLHNYKLQNTPIIKYCSKLVEQLENGGFISQGLNATKNAPEISIISDSGHGGSFVINYCPFCGTKITFEL